MAPPMELPPPAPVLFWPHPCLSDVTKPVTPEELASEDFRAFCGILVATMVHHKALGLAANQIGGKHSVFALQLGNNAFIFVNPSIAATHPFAMDRQEEGCLSFPGVTESLDGPNFVFITYTSLDGETTTQRLDGAWARAAFHECAHLRGETFLDRMKPLQKKMFLKRYDKAARQMARLHD